MQSVKVKYKTAQAFKVAIATRLSKLSKETGEPHLDLYRRVAIDRFLARLNWSKWTAKGGYVLQRRLPKARRTKDIDLATDDASFINSDLKAQQDALLEEFQQLARTEVSDYFSFEVQGAKPLPGFGKGGLRCNVKCFLAGEVWSTFQLDAVIQDETVFEKEAIIGDTVLSFADLEPLTLMVPTKEEVFAEKIHAYTTIREKENSRVKDMLDLALLIDDGLSQKKIKQALEGVFRIRATHVLPEKLEAPPASWQSIFSELVKDTEIDLTLDQAFSKAASFYQELSLD